MGSDLKPIGRRRVAKISIHAPRMGSDKGCRPVDYELMISIHAPRMGSDKGCRLVDYELMISIHAPRMGSDHYRLLPEPA